MRNLALTAVLITFSTSTLAVDLTVSDALVTRVQAYESANDSTAVWIHLNGNSRVGPNPVNPSVTCELWTYSKSVYAGALAALSSGARVSVTYVDRGDGTYFCKVQSFAVLSQ